MSKKKASSMTLKDFHGGSIPSDLPLPSAPGVFVRSADMSGHERPSSRVGSIGRPDQWVRPSSSPVPRRFDDKTPFLGPTVPIGCNFDEDERKPLDGAPVPRRTDVDDSFRVLPNRMELKLEPAFSERASGLAVRPHSANSYSGRGVAEGSSARLSSQIVAGNVNAWAARKESMVGIDEPKQSSLSGGSVVVKVAHASALEKVSSGRWQTKQSFQYQTDVVVTGNDWAEKVVSSQADDVQKYQRTGEFIGIDSDVKLARHFERSVAVEDGIQVPRKELTDHGQAWASSYTQLKGMNSSVHHNEVQHHHHHQQQQHHHVDGRFVGPVVQPPVPSQASERPKLKLLPRTKPLECLEMPTTDPKQGYRGANDSSHDHVTITHELHGNVKPGIAGDENENQAMDRPKLNLKPRSQPLEPSEGNNDLDRVGLFGGARPRELVLKERGIDDATISNLDLSQSSARVKHTVPKSERVAQHTITAHQGEKIENPSLNPSSGKKYEKKHQPTETERVDMRRNWHNENWTNSKETERQQQQQQLQRERQPLPETWHKPVEEQKPTTLYGKTASAVELAQAFSRSVSDTKAADPYSGHKVLPGKTQMPFSRLMGPSPRPHINGY